MKRAFLAGLILTALAASPALSQGAEQASRLKREFVECVWMAVLDNDNIKNGLRTKIEAAFLACKTEEDAILAFLRIANATQAAQAAALMVSIKTDIKQQILSTAR